MTAIHDPIDRLAQTLYEGAGHRNWADASTAEREHYTAAAHRQIANSPTPPADESAREWATAEDARRRRL